MKSNTKKLSVMGMLSALAVVSVMFIRFPVFPTATYLEYDFADVFIFICGFLFGPIEGLTVTVIVSVLQGVTVSSGSQIWGVIMHIWVTGSFVVTSSLIYKKYHTMKGAIVSLCCGFVVWLVMSVIGNIVITPIYTGMDVSVVKGMILFPILPFNLIKAGGNSIITFILYKQVSRLFDKMFADASQNDIGKVIAKLSASEYNERVEFISFSAGDTMKFAKRMAKTFTGGEIVTLNGELGAGKTVFAKGIATGLSVKRQVLSPTFNLVREYDGRLKMYHFDMYRLTDEAEVYETGVADCLGKGVCVIEWNKFRNLTGKIFVVDITKLSENKRKIQIVKGDKLNENTVR